MAIREPENDVPKTTDPKHPGRQLALVRYGGELTTKASATRKHFSRRLAANLADAIGLEKAGEGKIHRGHNRLLAEVSSPAELTALTRVFGVQSVSAVERRSWAGLDDLVTAGRELFSDAVRGKRFAVRVRRVGDRSRISVERVALERALGAELLPLSRGVDLGAPEVAARIELMPGEAYFFSESLQGPGGLPLGVEGRAVALMSGGFDSAVAAWQLMKRGVALDFVFCNLGGRAHQLEALRVLKQLSDRWSYGSHPHLHAVDFDAVSQELQEHTTTRYWQVLLKRLMLRAAASIAMERRAAAIVTGDAVGQVSSQTLQNLAVISEATPLPILRPLVGFNKDEILAIARRIGTYELSAQVGEYCALVPRKPATQAALAAIKAEEERLDPAVLEHAVACRGVFDLRSLDLDSLDAPQLETESVPDGALVIDLRSKAAFQGWHYPDALFLDFPHALRAVDQMAAHQPYVLYCEFGLKSAHLAERMRARGLTATHFKGGLAALIRYAQEQGIPTPDTFRRSS